MNTKHYTSTSHLKSAEYPVRFLRFILKKLKIRELFQLHVKNPRKRMGDYDHVSLLMFALSNHLFRSHSKNEYHQNFKRTPASKAIAKFTGIDKDHCPCERTVDDLLHKLRPNDFLPILPTVFRNLSRQKIFQLHPEFIPDGEFAITIDAQATHTYHENSQHPCKCCPYCLKRTRGTSVWYIHYDLVACFVAPNGLQIPLLVHRIRARPEWGELSEDKFKQECERTAFPLLLKELRHQFPKLPFCIHLDSLYPTDPNFTLLKELKMGYSIVKKVKVLKTVGEDCKGLKELSLPVEVDKESKRFDIHQTINYFNDVAYRGHKLSVIQLDEKSEKKPSKRFAKVTSKQTHWEWIVHQTLTKDNVAKIAKGSRIRWKQEDCFNTLQCRGFAIRHDFNRGSNAQIIRLYLTLIAFAISSIFAYSDLGRSILLNKRYTLMFTMRQMLTDIIYLNETIFECAEPVQLRFAKDPPLANLI